MNRLVIAAFLLCVPSLSFADTISVKDSKITSTIVYTDRATVTRKAIIDIPAGSHTVTFENLPLQMLPDSLRAEGQASAAVKFGAVVFKQVTAAEISSAKANELNAELDILEDQQKILNGEKQAIESKKIFLTTIGTQAALRTNENIAEINLKPEQWTGAADTLFKSINDTMAAGVAIDIKLRDLNKKINAIQSELNNVGSGQYSTYTVSVPLESAASTQLTLDLSYQVTNASWNPIYDARVNTDSSKLDIIQYGAVRQNSGEDWTGVKLTLSTAQPQRGSSLPDLTPQWVDLFNPEIYNNVRSAEFGAMSNSAPVPASMKMERADAMMQDQAMPLAAPKEKEASFAAAEITTGGFVSEYKIPGPATITADGTETKVMVGTFTTESILQVHVKPQLSTEAFLVAKAKLKGESPILPGQVSLFRDGAFVGKSSFPLLRPDEEYALFFGTDDQVSVKRKTLKDQKTEAGMIMRDNIQERHFITEIQNLHSKPVVIVVKETTPIGRNDKITTDILKDETTSGYEMDSANIKGLMRWEFTVEPKTKKDVKLGWKVTWPKDTNITGL